MEGVGPGSIAVFERLFGPVVELEVKFEMSPEVGAPEFGVGVVDGLVKCL
jgi:hypothetical protein